LFTRSTIWCPLCESQYYLYYDLLLLLRTIITCSSEYNSLPTYLPEYLDSPAVGKGRQARQCTWPSLPRTRQPTEYSLLTCTLLLVLVRATALLQLQGSRPHSGESTSDVSKTQRRELCITAVCKARPKCRTARKCTSAAARPPPPTPQHLKSPGNQG
jgi:hypothetical protein